MNTVQSIIDENKEKLSDGDYLKLCDAMYILYNQKVQTKLEIVYVDRHTEILADSVTNRRYTEIRGNSDKRGILFSRNYL